MSQNVIAVAPRIHIYSPTNDTNYKCDFVPVNITVDVNVDVWHDEPNSVIYCTLDGNTLNVNATRKGTTSDGWLVYNGLTTLQELKEGTHFFGVGTISSVNWGLQPFPYVKFSVNGSLAKSPTSTDSNTDPESFLTLIPTSDSCNNSCDYSFCGLLEETFTCLTVG